MRTKTKPVKAVTPDKTIKRVKLGRPKIPRDQQRSHLISVRFTKEELFRLQEEKVHQCTAEMIRELALEGLARKKELRTKKKIKSTS